GGGDVKVAAEIIPHPPLRRIAVPVFDPAIGVVDPPHRIGQVLAEMTKNDIKPWVLVEQARAHQAQSMDRSFVTECPDRTKQPGMTLVYFAIAWQRIARVQIERHIEPLHRRPERPISRQIVIDNVFAVLRETVDQRATKAKLLHTALELARR